MVDLARQDKGRGDVRNVVDVSAGFGTSNGFCAFEMRNFDISVWKDIWLSMSKFQKLWANPENSACSDFVKIDLERNGK